MNPGIGVARDLFRDMYGREPGTKRCAICSKPFREDSLSSFELGESIDTLNVCWWCLSVALYNVNYGDNFMTREEIIRYLLDLNELTGSIPLQSHGGIETLVSLTKEDQLRLVKLQIRGPNPELVKELFGSWLKALIESGLLPEGILKTKRGYHCIAKDGHACRSIGEMIIDDWLYKHGIDHQREKRYPDSAYRADFYVGDCYIEYWGLAGDPDYDMKSSTKRTMCGSAKLRLIELYPEDVESSTRLASKLGELM
jgi:hypothetical protein